MKPANRQRASPARVLVPVSSEVETRPTMEAPAMATTTPATLGHVARSRRTSTLNRNVNRLRRRAEGGVRRLEPVRAACGGHGPGGGGQNCVYGDGGVCEAGIVAKVGDEPHGADDERGAGGASEGQLLAGRASAFLRVLVVTERVVAGFRAGRRMRVRIRATGGMSAGQRTVALAQPSTPPWGGKP